MVDTKIGADWARGPSTADQLSSDARDPVIVDAFWAARPSLAHLRDFARARRAAPWAVLGVALARVIVATPPRVVLPPIVGTDASLNTFLALVGASGDGKGAATGAAIDALHVGEIISWPVGSGEGLIHLFVKRDKGNVVQHTTAVLATVAEIDTLSALKSRPGSTILPVLRQAAMGEELGFANADPSRRLVVPAHSYRLALVVGVQPRRAGGLLNDAAGGTPQRFVWLPTTDRDAPDTAPPTPEPWRWRMPALPQPRLGGGRLRLVGGIGFDGRVRVPVCDTAQEAVQASRLARLRGQGEPLNGHALLVRLKVAAALGLLDGRAEISETDWGLAGTVMMVSDSTRAGVLSELQEVTQHRTQGRAAREAERAEAVADGPGQTAVVRVANLLRRKLAKAGTEPISHSDLRRAVAGRDRKWFEEAITLLIDAEEVTVEETDTGGAGGQRCRRYTSNDLRC